MDTLSITATLDKLPEIMEFVRNFSLSHSATAEQLMAIELAVEEIVVNIINYAYPENNPGSIELSCQINTNNQLIIQITDGGEKYNPLSRGEPNINASVEERGVGGLGVFLTKQMMDDVIYKYENAKNILTLTKNLDANEKP